MCGIIGYCGNNNIADVLIEGLRKLEYRGYDSAGLACVNDCGVNIVHSVGKVDNLKTAIDQDDSFLSQNYDCGIGHTRWATHGRPCKENAHPHFSCDKKIAVVHNGIIENYIELKQHLTSKGHLFTSETDTEVLAHLIEEHYDGNLLSSLHKAISYAHGAYGVAVVSEMHPGEIVVTAKDSPIILGYCDEGAYVASDIYAITHATRQIVVLRDGQFAHLCKDAITYYDCSLNKIEPEYTNVDWDIDSADKGSFPDFMLKEIHEQPRVIRDTLSGRLVDGYLSIDELSLSLQELQAIDRVCIIACGTSYHAGLVAKQLIEAWARVVVEVEVASEFRYRDPIITSTTLVVAVSQSGETADTLAAIRDAKIKGAKVFGITNVTGSPVARESDGVIYTRANKEIAVASTKSFIGQLVSLTLLSLVLAQSKSTLNTTQVKLLFSELADTANQVQTILKNTEDIDAAAAACVNASSALYIGRGYGCAISYEGALKLKEISYMHAEAYPAGEMKHGPIALLSDGFPVIAIATQSPTYDKTISNLQESKARGALVVAIATEGDEEIKKHADHVIYVPKVRDCFSPITASVPLQLFARSIAVSRNCNVDQPRNLAKSVTVE